MVKVVQPKSKSNIKIFQKYSGIQNVLDGPKDLFCHWNRHPHRNSNPQLLGSNQLATHRRGWSGMMKQTFNGKRPVLIRLTGLNLFQNFLWLNKTIKNNFIFIFKNLTALEKLQFWLIYFWQLKPNLFF